MEKAQLPLRAELSLVDASDFTTPARNFAGTDNPRHIRVLDALFHGDRSTKEIAAIGGCTNAPELIAELRRRGLAVPCRRVAGIDRDGVPVRYGVYALSDDDRPQVHAWMRTRAEQKGG